MRRLTAFTALLAFLLTLSACGGKSSSQDPPSPTAVASGPDVTLYNCGGLQVALPIGYQDLLLVETDFPETEEGWKPLISVYEKASVEAAQADFGDGSGFGFLFGFLCMDQAAFEQNISSDGSGIDIFAVRGERYYAYTYPTDVQFYRPGGVIGTESDDWKTWEAMNDIGPLVRDDFLTRNSLQSFSVQDFLVQLADDGNHVFLKYYSYFLKDGDTRIYDTLLLHQPARQGEGGIWAVDQWLDEYGSQYLYFPDSGKPAAEYYAQLQEECDAGQHQELLTPAGAAAAFVEDYFGHEATEGSFEETPGINQMYMEVNRRLQQVTLDLMAGRDVEHMELLDCVAQASAGNWGVLGRNSYGSDWYAPLMNAVANAAIGTEQQRRDEAVLSFLLAAGDFQTDFRTPLNDVLKRQKEADLESFDAALASFPEGTFSIEPGTGIISGAVGGSGEQIIVDVPTS